jgi:hypothetical protein
MWALCTVTSWAQEEHLQAQESGYVNIVSSARPSYLLGEECDERYTVDGVDLVGVVNTLQFPEANTKFYLDTIVSAKYLLALDAERVGDAVKGRYMFNAAALVETDPRYVWMSMWPRIGLMEAVHAKDALYFPAPDDLSRLDELAEAGTIQKIDLKEANNFTFSFLMTGESGFSIQSEAVGGGSIRVQIGALISSNLEGELFTLKSIEGDLPTDNEPVAAVEPAEVTYHNGVLSVNTLPAESIEVYSVSGQLSYRAQKAAGFATFDLSGLPGGVYIVRGGSGWTKKVIK